MPRSINKSAKTGLIVSDAEVASDPDGTYEQTTHPKKTAGVAAPPSGPGRPRSFDQRFGVGKVPKGHHEDRLYAWRSRVYALAADIQSTLPDGPERDAGLDYLEKVSAAVQQAIEEAE